jgi:hypothetical protein
MVIWTVLDSFCLILDRTGEHFIALHLSKKLRISVIYSCQALVALPATACAILPVCQGHLVCSKRHQDFSAAGVRVLVCRIVLLVTTTTAAAATAAATAATTTATTTATATTVVPPPPPPPPPPPLSLLLLHYIFFANFT